MTVAPRTRVWTLPEPLDGDAWRSVNSDPVLAELLWRRGLRDELAALDFLDPGPRPPDGLVRVAQELPNFAAAVARGVEAIRAGERVGVFGDYDADGTTAAAILTLFFAAAIGDAHLDTCLPERATGYGLCAEDVRRLAGHGNLMLVVDTGSSDYEHVALARSLGLEVVILDHHQLDAGSTGPDGAITVSAYLTPAGASRDPLRDLTGAGLAWVYVVAVADALGDARLRVLAASLQDLAMLGTVADVADLRGLNRRLVRDGLRVVRTQPRPGVVALCGAVRLDPATLTAQDGSMKLAPRLNAAGRMGEATLALRLLLAPDTDRAAPLAAQLERLNGERRSEMERVIREADTALIAAIGQPGGLSSSILVAHRSDWPNGVIGPAASRILDRYGKPVVLLCDDPAQPGVARGSARSVPGFDIAAALRDPACLRLLLANGGHSAAAGLTLRAADIPVLATTLETLLEQTMPFELQEQLGAERLTLDAILSADRLTLKTARAVSQLSPFGQGNPNPLFYVPGVPLLRRTLFGKDKARQHLKLFVGEPGMAPVEVILWGGEGRFAEAASAGRIDLAVRIGINRWNGQTKLEAIAEDFRLAR